MAWCLNEHWMLDGGVNLAAGLRVNWTETEEQHSGMFPFGCGDGECWVGCSGQQSMKAWMTVDRPYEIQ